ncbi:hypothetical protein GALL_260260 [mine drainage metagenome]|uniref:Uncharacterized protein n=1 Tax=mine drainage metagenome TaxID=410659 RepID=A0A1J5R9K9_9ZZZZ
MPSFDQPCASHPEDRPPAPRRYDPGSVATPGRPSRRRAASPSGGPERQHATAASRDSGRPRCRRPWTRRNRPPDQFRGRFASSCARPGSRDPHEPRTAPSAETQPSDASGAGRGAPRGSGREFLAALAPTSGKDRAAGTGPHAQAEAMGLGPAPVVRLKGPLAHECLQLLRGSSSCPCGQVPGQMAPDVVLTNGLHASCGQDHGGCGVRGRAR